MLTGLYKVLGHPSGQVQENSKTIPFSMEDIQHEREAGQNLTSPPQGIYKERGR